MFPDFTSYTFPDWATTDAAKVWLMGFMGGALTYIIHAALQWFRRAGDPGEVGGE